MVGMGTTIMRWDDLGPNDRVELEYEYDGECLTKTSTIVIRADGTWLRLPVSRPIDAHSQTPLGFRSDVPA